MKEGRVNLVVGLAGLALLLLGIWIFGPPTTGKQPVSAIGLLLCAVALIGNGLYQMVSKAKKRILSSEMFEIREARDAAKDDRATATPGFGRRSEPPIRLTNNATALGITAATADLLTAEHRRVVAVRSALRAFGGIADFANGNWSFQTSAFPAVFHSARAVFISWTSVAYGEIPNDAIAAARRDIGLLVEDFDRAFESYYEQNIISSDYGLSAMQNQAEAGRRVASLILWATDAPLLQPPRDFHFDDLFDSAGTSGTLGPEDWRVVQRQAIDIDVENLRSGNISVQELAHSQLWSGRDSETLVETYHKHGWRNLRSRFLNNSIVDWLEERRTGQTVCGLPYQEAASRCVALASQPSEFWSYTSHASSQFANALRGR
jgi:hypothetical protein